MAKVQVILGGVFGLRTSRYETVFATSRNLLVLLHYGQELLRGDAPGLFVVRAERRDLPGGCPRVYWVVDVEATRLLNGVERCGLLNYRGRVDGG